MKTAGLQTKDRLVQTAARLFRQRGYHGVGLSEILSESHTPKGSLYHHFPDGKSDLALAAAHWASDRMLRCIDDAFESAPDLQSGIRTLCLTHATMFETQGRIGGCPVVSVLPEEEEDDMFSETASDIIDGWTDRVTDHAMRLGADEDFAREMAEGLMLLLQGAWTTARVRRSGDVFRNLPKMFEFDQV